jgi:trigger factor
MKVSVERLPQSQAALEVEVESEQVEEALHRAYVKLVRSVNIPGFRRGKAPRHILERYVGKERLKSEAIESLISRHFPQAVKEANLEPVDRPDVDVLKFEEGEPFHFKATVAVKPEVKLGDYRSIAVAREEPTIGDDEVDAVLESLLESRATLEPAPEDARLTPGMFAVVSMVDASEKKVEALNRDDYTLEVGRDHILPGVDAQLEGAVVGETRTVTARFPEDLPDEDLRGAEVKFEVTVKSLKVKVLPELDDEFVKSLGRGLETVEELRQQVKNNLEQTARERARRRQLEEIQALLLSTSEVELPPVMVESKLEGMWFEFIEGLENRQIELETYLRFANKSEEEMRESLRDPAERAVKWELVVEAVAAAEHLEATADDLERLLVELAGRYRSTPDAMRALFMQRPGGMQHLKAAIITDKTVDFLSDTAHANATTGDKEETTADGEVTLGESPSELP